MLLLNTSRLLYLFLSTKLFVLFLQITELHWDICTADPMLAKHALRQTWCCKDKWLLQSLLFWKLYCSLNDLPIVPVGCSSGSLVLILEPEEEFNCRRFENLQIRARGWKIILVCHHFPLSLAKNAPMCDTDLFITPTNPALPFLSFRTSLS